MLGGIFAVHFELQAPEMLFRSKPLQWKCDSFDILLFQRPQTMAFAIEEINRDQSLLPNITLGYRILDNCMNLQVSLRAAVSLIAGQGDTVNDNNCTGPPPVVAVIGEPLSSYSIAVARLLGLFSVPQVSYCASSPLLSNKREFPSFFRTVPSEAFQVIPKIIQYFGWTWVGAIGSDDDYGVYALKSFSEEHKKFGCIAFSEAINVNDKSNLKRAVKVVQQSSAKVIVVFLTKLDASTLINEIAHQNITGKQWIASDSWSAFAALASNENFKYFGGTIGVTARRGVIPGLEQYLLQAKPDYDQNNNLLKQFWEKIFGCKFNINDTATKYTMENSKECTGLEDLKSTKTEYSDVSQLRATYNVYKAVYAVAQALHNLNNCEHGKGPFEGNTCADITSVKPWQLLHYLKETNFTVHLGERVTFDENGDALPVFDIVNWQQTPDKMVISKTIGVFDQFTSSGQQLVINKDDIFWNFNSGTAPESVCSKSCQPGSRKAHRKGEPTCCFDCLPCADGEISSHLDSTECLICPPDFWSNQKRNKCILKEVEFLSYEDAMGITLTTTALLGGCSSVVILAIFIYFRKTPVVKANNSELSFLLLVSLMLCFLCSLCFIGEPTHLSCRLRHVAFGISFVLSISCILVKTIVVIMAFKATKPGKSVMKWFGATQQRGTVFFFTFIQALICIIWLTTAPPFPNKNTKYQNAKIIFECDIGSVAGFSCLLGYIGLLACISFLLAFIARGLPDTFNEAKFITFSMLIFCAVWITFIPAYISSPGKHTVAVEIFAILASSFGLLFAIFAPKCYVILFKPEKNTKKALMGKDIGKNK
ncbi:extracellular calcium-sensing receptor-like isoform X2 [Erpetoichthys calabaricus]|uniref:extracellular calcium-sensing receptor-like isoform X2 n=1 Tax=Erpetoichthys calabaricus TaxID=27687 RepID=UPI00223408CD|nr:extracellular calcium-sensing receptor-like isoform X2 [Erpetoichthys calabaricus]